MTEDAVLFGCEGERLVGVLAQPASPTEAVTGVVVVVGGPQYRAGSHRQFVQLARALASAGWPVLRFDVRGMGDSSGDLRNFENITPDIGAAVDALCLRVPCLRRVVIWGLCDAASAALLYLDERRDPRVAGLVLLNPWVRSAQTFAQAQVSHYYSRRLFDRATWKAALSGRIGLSSFADFAFAVVRSASRRLTGGTRDDGSFQARMARGWKRFGGPTLLVLSGNDLTAQEFVGRMRTDAELAALCASSLVTTQHLQGADHTLSASGDSRAHEGALVEWLRARSLS